MAKSRDDFEVKKPVSTDFNYDEEALDFMDGKGPAMDAGTPVTRVVKEVKRNWWLWGAVGFALVLITGVVMFRHKLYNTGNFGLPFLAVNESAAEACASKCSPADADGKLFSAEEPHDVKTKQEYDVCYSKCVAQETKEVVQEREKFKESEEKLEQGVEDKLGQEGTAVGTAAKTAGGSGDVLLG
ncbi:hypothetical protein ABBQ38_011834 [Trebouxia sp. C0009 RCD-2024]